MRAAPQPIATRRVLVDTSAYFALANTRDASHTVVQTIAQGLARLRFRQFTTNLILAETHALLLTRIGRSLAVRVLDELDAGATVVVRVSARDEQRAREILRQYADKDFSLTDAASFAVMERLRISLAFSLDHHFQQYGYSLATPETATEERR